jgi:acetyl esterase
MMDTTGHADTLVASLVRTEDRLLPGPHGDIPIRIYSPLAPKAAPIGLVWCHGGAFCYGDLDGPESDWVAASLAAAGITVVAVDYRLAPVPQWALDLGADPGSGTSHYPVASDEIEAVFDWASTEMSSASPAGWVLGGASAGGTLTAGLTMRMRDRGGLVPRRLLLAYPLLHSTLPEYRPELAAKLAAQPDPTGIVLTRQVVEAISLNYVNGDLELLRDPYVFPGGGHDLTGFPPTLIINSDVDTIRASGEAFAAELAAAGVDVYCLREAGAAHGHLSDPDDLGGQRSVQRMIGWLTAAWVQPTVAVAAEPPRG